MKKTAMILSVALLIPFALSAQTTIGFTGGINLANIHGADATMHEEGLDFEPSDIMGFAGGLFLNIAVGEKFSFRPEFLYTQKGTKYEASFGEMEIESKLKFAYLEVPLLLQYNLPAGDNLGIFLIGGGYLGYNMSAKVEIKVTGLEEDEEDMKDEVENLDYGILFGAGVVINNMIELSARYSMGLAKIPIVEEGEQPDAKNKAIEIRAGFRLSK